MTEFNTVWEGVGIIIVGTVLSIVVLFFGGIIWDTWYGHFEATGVFDDAPGTSFDNFGGIVNGPGNMFYTISILGILISWAAGLVTVYHRQRYDRYIRQY